MKARQLVFAGVLAMASLATDAAPLVQSFETDSMARIVASQQGKAFVLVIWSLDCEYCFVSLNTLAAEKRNGSKVNVITLATDALADPQARALLTDKLQMTGLTTPAWAFGSAAPEQLRYAIDPGWHGELPRSYWFNASGGRVAYSGLITAKVIAKLNANHSGK